MQQSQAHLRCVYDNHQYQINWITHTRTYQTSRHVCKETYGKHLLNSSFLTFSSSKLFPPPPQQTNKQPLKTLLVGTLAFGWDRIKVCANTNVCLFELTWHFIHDFMLYILHANFFAFVSFYSCFIGELMGCFSNDCTMYIYTSIVSPWLISATSAKIWSYNQSLTQPINQSFIFWSCAIINYFIIQLWVCESFGMSGMSMNLNDIIHFIDKNELWTGLFLLLLLLFCGLSGAGLCFIRLCLLCVFCMRGTQACDNQIAQICNQTEWRWQKTQRESLLLKVHQLLLVSPFLSPPLLRMCVCVFSVGLFYSSLQCFPYVAR